MKSGMNNDFSTIASVPAGLWVLIGIILFSQAFWLFWDASKRNANKWMWGLLGLVQFPTPLLLYLLIVRKALSKDKRQRNVRNTLIILWILVIIVLLIVGSLFYN